MIRTFLLLLTYCALYPSEHVFRLAIPYDVCSVVTSLSDNSFIIAYVVVAQSDFLYHTRYRTNRVHRRSTFSNVVGERG